jgi:hypothetical protein
MTTLEIIQIIGICLLMGCALVYRHKYLKEARLRERQHFEDDMNFQLVNARYLKAIEELAETKAELEQYKNHSDNTYKLLSLQAKVSTSGGGMGDYAILVVDEFSVINEARYTFALRGEQYIGYGLPKNKIKALPMTPTVSTPEIPLETIYITFG